MRLHTLALVVLFALGTTGRLHAQAICPAGVITCTANNGGGDPTRYQDTVTDVAYRPGKKQLWAIEGLLANTRIAIYNEDLQAAPSILINTQNLGVRGFGIAEIPAHMPFPGNIYVLAPVNAADGLDPRIGILNDAGQLIPEPEGAFTPVLDENGLPLPGLLAALDVHSTEDEIAILDDGRAGGGIHMMFVNSQYRAIPGRGPFRLEGLGSFFGGGIAYNSKDTVLVLAQFRSSFEVRLAMEYKRIDGTYTGRSVVLDAIATAAVPAFAQGIDVGFVGATPSLFLYNIYNDALYGLPLDLVPMPGPVAGIPPDCARLTDGRVRLTWTNNPAYAYDQIVVLENGVEVASLPSDAVEFTSPQPVAGKSLYCVETRQAGSPNVISSCCEAQSAILPSFLPEGAPIAVALDVDPQPGRAHFVAGMAGASIVESKDDFRLHILGSHDNLVRTFDFKRDPVVGESLVTQPQLLSVVQNGALVDFAATGIAHVEVTLGATMVPLYAVLDVDGTVNDRRPRASLHFLKDTTLPGDPALHVAGSRFQDKDVNTIDLSQITPGGLFIMDWDADAEGRLIALDFAQNRLIKFEYSVQDHTLRAIQEGELPFRELSPFAGRSFPLGGITVLPSGHYMVTGGDTLDTTMTRAFLLTPLDADANKSVKFTGYVEGLLTFGQFLPFDIVGHTQGPPDGFGVESVFFKNEGPDGKGLGVLYYNMPHFFPTPARSFNGNWLVSLASPAIHPDLKAERLDEREGSMLNGGTFDSNSLTPSFANQVSQIDYHFHVFNPSLIQSVDFNIKVLLDGVEVPELGETGLSIPAGRSLYRAVLGRAEKDIRIVLQNRSPQTRDVRLLVGALAIKGTGPVQPKFRRADFNQDGTVDLTDPISTLNYLFLGGDDPLCPDSADSDDDGRLEVTDPIFSLNYQFQGGPVPPSPGPTDCGPDPTAEEPDLGECVSSAACP